MTHHAKWHVSAAALALLDRRPARAVAAGIGLTMVLGAGILLHVWQSTIAAADANQRLANARQLAAELDQTLTLTKDADRAQRGYLLTGEQHFADACRADAAALESCLQRLPLLLNGDPEQMSQLAVLEPAVTQDVTSLRQVTGAAPAPANGAVLADRAEALTRQVTTYLSPLQAAADRLVMQSAADPSDAVGFTFFALNLMAFATLCLTCLAAKRYIAEREETDKQRLRARLSSDEASKRASQSVAEINRHVRTCLTGILGYCDMPAASDADRLASIRRNAESMQSVLDKIGELPVAGASSADPAPAQQAKGRVLLAEDGPDNQKVIAFFLTEAGAEVTTVADGISAFHHAIAAKIEGRPYGLTLLDVRMPGIDGCTVARMLRDSGYRFPIIALTADATLKDRERCLNAGCNDFLTKPIHRAEFFRVVNRHLSAPLPAPSPDQAAEPDFSASPEFIALQRCFQAEVPARVSAIENAIATQALSRAAELAHQLKGTAGTYGLADVSEAAAALQVAVEHPQEGNLQECFASFAHRCAQAVSAKAA